MWWYSEVARGGWFTTANFGTTGRGILSPPGRALSRDELVNGLSDNEQRAFVVALRCLFSARRILGDLTMAPPCRPIDEERMTAAWNRINECLNLEHRRAIRMAATALPPLPPPPPPKHPCHELIAVCKLKKRQRKIVELAADGGGRVTFAELNAVGIDQEAAASTLYNKKYGLKKKAKAKKWRAFQDDKAIVFEQMTT